MKYRQFAIVIIMLAGLAVIGAGGCEVEASTDSEMHEMVMMGAWDYEVRADADSEIYELKSEGQTTLYNESYDTIFLPGCSLFNLEKLESGVWQDKGPQRFCIWEGIGVSVATGDSVSSSFIVPSELGTWRMHYVVSYGCDKGKPLSQANCDGQKDIYTPVFEVVGQTQPSCEDLGRIDFGMCEMLLNWAVVNGECQAISGCDGQGFQFFSTELECLSQCATDCEDWYGAYYAEVESVSTCESADQCEALPGTSCGCTRNLVVNGSSDLAYLRDILNATNNAGCGIYTTCDCPPADGFVCEEGHCAWNYI